MLKNIFIIIALFFTLPAWAGNGVSATSIFDKMNYREVLEVTLEADYEKILADRRNEDKFPAKLTFADENGVPQTWDLKLSLRGKYRRMKCAEMPPLKLKFKKEDLSLGGLSASNDLKLVTQCVENEKEARDLLLREYLTYKLYNELTDASYRVQLLKIKYKDATTGKKKNHWAFLIEDTAQLRARLGAEKVKKSDDFSQEDVDEQLAATAAMFQYMIGNHDWNLIAGKNIKLVKTGGEILPIPYDFDFASLVNAPYSTGNASLGVKTRYDRVFLGKAEQNEALLNSTFETFSSKEKELKTVIKDFKYLSMSERKDMIKYIGTFFEAGADLTTKAEARAAVSAATK